MATTSTKKKKTVTSTKKKAASKSKKKAASKKKAPAKSAAKKAAFDKKIDQAKVKQKPMRIAYYAPYHDNGGLGVLDHYAAQFDGFEYDALTMVSSRYRILKDDDCFDERATYLVELWYAAIDLAVEDGRGNWFTRIVRHQLAAYGYKPDYSGADLTVDGVTISRPSDY